MHAGQALDFVRHRTGRVRGEVALCSRARAADAPELHGRFDLVEASLDRARAFPEAFFTLLGERERSFGLALPERNERRDELAFVRGLFRA